MKKNKIFIVLIIVLLFNCKQRVYVRNVFWDKFQNINFNEQLKKRKLINDEQIMIHERLINEQRNLFLSSLKKNKINISSEKLIFIEAYVILNSKEKIDGYFQLIIDIFDDKILMVSKEDSSIRELNKDKKKDIEYVKAVNNFYKNFPKYEEYCDEKLELVKNKVHYFIITKTSNNGDVNQTININLGWTQTNNLNKYNCPREKEIIKYIQRLSSFLIIRAETGVLF